MFHKIFITILVCHTQIRQEDVLREKINFCLVLISVILFVSSPSHCYPIRPLNFANYCCFVFSVIFFVIYSYTSMILLNPFLL